MLSEGEMGAEHRKKFQKYINTYYLLREMQDRSE